MRSVLLDTNGSITNESHEVTELEQAKADLAFLQESQNVGMSRYEQMTPVIYDIYRRWGFDGQTKSVRSAIVTLAQAIENGERLKDHPLLRVGMDAARPGADHTVVSYLNDNGNVAEV